jgi:NADH:ubiquinone oxidoreductase subunit 6 (subunit J)
MAWTGVTFRWNGLDSISIWMSVMTTFLTVLVGLAMLGTVGVLFAGLIGLARGGENTQRSNVLMRWRVVLQGVALVLFIILLSLLRH